LLNYGRHCDNFFDMSTLAEIEAAADALSLEQKEELIRFLSARLRQPNEKQRARVVREGDDVLLEAPPGALPMTPDNVKRMLEDWP
jgi:hypothetical protein